jgi:hypothetical protein
MQAPLAAAVALAVALAAACGDSGSKDSGEGAACGAATDCRSGLVCFEQRCAVGYPAGSCTPPGSPRIALGEPSPEPPDDSCRRAVVDPVFAASRVQDLGSWPVGRVLQFDVPPAARAFTIMSQAVNTPAPDVTFDPGTAGQFSLPNTVVPTDVRDPDGALVFSDTAAWPVDRAGYYDATGLQAFFFGATPLSSAFTIPNTAAGLDRVRTIGQMRPGRWQLTVNDWAHECETTPSLSCTPGAGGPGEYRVQVVTQPGRFASSGTLDLEVYLATDPATSQLRSADDAVNGGGRPHVDRLVRSLATYFGRAGICLGTVTFHDLPPLARARHAPNGVVDITSGDPCSDLPQLFTLAVARRTAVHVVLADQITDRSSGSGQAHQVLGVDGSIPGPSGYPGTINGGAVAGIFDALGAAALGSPPDACSRPGPRLDCGTDQLAYVIAHEAGHWLGLYHVTESSGSFFDPLSDTATCPCELCTTDRNACAGGTGEVVNSQCMGRRTVGGWATGSAVTCGGGRNLMFWLLDQESSTGELSFQQGDVMRLNPAVQ